MKSGKPCPGQGTFGHITGGYDAGYYGYMYSLVYAADMYGEWLRGEVTVAQVRLTCVFP